MADVAPQTFTAPDGQVFTDMAAYNAYLAQLRARQSAQSRQSALTIARNNAQNAIRSRGVDEAFWMGKVNDQLDALLAGVPEGDTNYGSYIDPNLGANLLTQSESGLRNLQRDFLDNLVTTGESRAGISDSFLDGIINEQLGNETATAQEHIARGQKRGQFNEAGVKHAGSALANARTKASSRLNAYEGDILSGYKGKLSSINDKYSAKANNYSLTGSRNMFDVLGSLDKGYNNDINSLSNSFKSNAAGDLLNLIGDDPLIDLGTIVGKAGQGQGALNLQNLDVLEALDRKKREQNNARGIGTQGAF